MLKITQSVKYIFLFGLFLATEAYCQSDSMKTPYVPAPNPAPALEDRRWKYITRTDDEKLYYDKKNLKRKKNGTVIVWTKSKPNFVSIEKIKKKMTEEHSDFKGYENYSHTLRKEEYDCNNDRHRILARIDYDSDGATLETFDDSNAEWSAIVPESIGEVAEKVFCK